MEDEMAKMREDTLELQKAQVRESKDLEVARFMKEQEESEKISVHTSLAQQQDMVRQMQSQLDLANKRAEQLREEARQSMVEANKEREKRRGAEADVEEARQSMVEANKER